MNKQETALLLGYLKTAYPRFYATQSESEISSAVALWADLLQDYSSELVMAAARLYAKTEEYPPSPAGIIKKITAMTSMDEMSPAEAWSLVRKAISDSSYNSDARFKELPPILQRCVGSPNQLRDWARMDETALTSFEATRFQKLYTEQINSNREYNLLSADDRQRIEAATINRMIDLTV